MTKFSIIMPVYNNEMYLPLAVESVERQDYDNYELIIIDDGSTDNTPEIVDKLASSNPHIRAVHQKNQWIYNSFNNGIALATGDYIYILNSDDRLVEGVLMLFEKKIEKFHPDIIWTKVLIHECDSEQKILCYDKYNWGCWVKEERFYSNKNDVEKAWPYFLSSKLAINQANLYRREIMQSQLFRNDVVGADTLYNLSVADNICSALVLQEPVYSYYVYGTDNMNASVGKYYGYEHEMYNEIYNGYCQLFQSWNLKEDDYIELLSKMRMTSLTHELRALQAANCPLTIEDKLRFAFCDCIDETIQQCVKKTNREEELESRILSAVRELLVKEDVNTNNKMYFVYELLESLLCYEKSTEDFKRIQSAVNHIYNPFRIGLSFWKKLV